MILSREVLAYSSSATSCSRILSANWFEVLVLSFLRKGNTAIVFKVYNATVELKIIARSKAFTFLS